MVFGIKSLIHLDLSLYLTDTRISKVLQHKHLGLVSNDTLTWVDHVNYVCSNAFRNFFYHCLLIDISFDVDVIT